MEARREPEVAVVDTILFQHDVESPTFHELLFEWMERAPWLVISLAAHVIVLLVMSMIPWNLFEVEDVVGLQAQLEQPALEPFEEPPVEIIEELPDEPEVDEPVVFDDQVVPDPSPVEMDDNSTPEGDPDSFDVSPFNELIGGAEIGIGGPPGGNYGNRFPGGPGGDGGRGNPPRGPISDSLQWLVAHQDSDGKWDADGFMKHDPGGEACSGPGHAEHDVGITALALLALLGDGNTTRRGAFKDNVARGAHWLFAQQDPDTGLIGERIGHSFMYDHAIATLALCEVYYFSKSPLMKSRVQNAVAFVTRARSPYGVWRYDAPGSGDQDTSVTGWMILALKSAQEAGLMIDSAAFADTLSYLDEVTDPATGRAGYAVIGEPSSRVPGVNDHYPVDTTESMTSVALLCRTFLGQTPDDTPAMRQGADLLREALPEHDPDGLGNDLYYWYYGSYAMYQLGGRDWKLWSRALDGALVQHQRRDGSEKGSWDPDGPWGMIGGRVYATALGALCLEAYYRYSRVLGGR